MYRRKQKQLEMSIKVKEGGKVGFSAVNWSVCLSVSQSVSQPLILIILYVSLI
jgi:hypothetical protein